MGVPDRSAISQMRRAALRLLLVLAVLNAAVLSLVGLFAGAADELARTALVATVALVVAAWPLTRADRLENVLSRGPWLPVGAAGVGGLALALDPTVRGTLLPAFLTPVGVCVLFACWRQALGAAALLIAGYLLGGTEGGAHDSLETALSDILPVFAMIAGGLLPARIAFSTIRTRDQSVASWRTDRAHLAPRSAVGKPGIARAHDAAILAGVLAGRSDKAMAVELGMGKASWRVRDRRQRLQREHGVSSRHELAALLSRSTQRSSR